MSDLKVNFPSDLPEDLSDITEHRSAHIVLIELTWKVMDVIMEISEFSDDLYHYPEEKKKNNQNIIKKILYNDWDEDSLDMIYFPMLADSEYEDEKSHKKFQKYRRDGKNVFLPEGKSSSEIKNILLKEISDFATNIKTKYFFFWIDGECAAYFGEFVNNEVNIYYSEEKSYYTCNE